MKSNVYKCTVEQLEDSHGNDVELSPLIFEARSHEDIFKIAEMIKSKTDVDDADATAFAVGLKIFSGAMLNNKDDEMFKKLMPHFKELMLTLKKS